MLANSSTSARLISLTLYSTGHPVGHWFRRAHAVAGTMAEKRRLGPRPTPRLTVRVLYLAAGWCDAWCWGWSPGTRWAEVSDPLYFYFYFHMFSFSFQDFTFTFAEGT